MVVGLDTFKEHFKDFQDAYLIIGGTACDILIDEAGFEPRATDDIDMILIIEAIEPAFVEAFWGFIKLGNYATKEYDAKNKNCYRFCKPSTKGFPKQIELFCKTPEVIELKNTLHLTPIPTKEGLSNLSAILLDHNYYNFTIAHSTQKNNVHTANAEALICLKAYAYLDNKKRKEARQNIRTRDITKHKYDVFRMVFLMPPNSKFILPEVIKTNLQEFVDDMKNDLPSPEIFKANGFGRQDMGKLLNQLIQIFGLEQ